MWRRQPAGRCESRVRGRSMPRQYQYEYQSTTCCYVVRDWKSNMGSGISRGRDGSVGWGEKVDTRIAFRGPGRPLPIFKGFKRKIGELFVFCGHGKEQRGRRTEERTETLQKNPPLPYKGFFDGFCQKTLTLHKVF